MVDGKDPRPRIGRTMQEIRQQDTSTRVVVHPCEDDRQADC